MEAIDLNMFTRWSGEDEKTMKKSIVLSSLVLLLISPQSFAEDKPSASFEDKMIQGNKDISQWFDGIAEGIDLFIVGKRLTTRRNETSVKMENITFVKEREAVKNESSLNVDLRLPNVEEYWQLKFTTYDETKEKRNAQKANLRQSPRDRNYGATVGVFRKLGNVRTAFQPRLELQDPLKVSHSLTFESVAEMKGYDINPKLEFFANSGDGTGVYSAINFHLVLTKIYSLTFINDGEYKEKSHLYGVTNGVSLGQEVTKTSSLSYNLFFDSNNNTNYHLESYSFSLGWNQLLYRKILSYQVSPFLEFSKSLSYTGVPGVNFVVSLDF